MRIEAPTLVRHLDKLEDDRASSNAAATTTDRRVVRVYPTAAGRSRFERFHAVVSQADDELRDTLGEATPQRWFVC